MKSCDLLTGLLPHAEELAHDPDVLTYMDAPGNLSQLAALIKRHSARIVSITAVISGKTKRELRSLPFYTLLADVADDAIAELFSLVRLVAAFGIQSVTKAVYTYRPPSCSSLIHLISADAEQRAIDVYKCDILRFIAGVFAEDRAALPTIRDILTPQKKPLPPPEKSGMDILNDIMFSALGGHTNEQQA